MKEPEKLKPSDLTYNSYLKVKELISLQTPQSEPPHHDEMLFIIIHQAYELWFKLMIREVERAISHLYKGEALEARHFIQRNVEIMKVMVPQIHLLETMRPVDFLEFRDRLNPASGFQSLQFREIEFACGLKDAKYLKFFESRKDDWEQLKLRMEKPDLRAAFYELMTHHGMPKGAYEMEETPEGKSKILEVLTGVYKEPQKNLPVYLLCESLLELDEYLVLFRNHHVMVVERIIGFKKGTGGSAGVEYLRTTLSKKAFPLLWEVRTHLVKEGSKPYGG